MKVGQIWVQPRNDVAWLVVSRNCYETDTHEGFLISAHGRGMLFNIIADKQTGQPVSPDGIDNWFLLEEPPKGVVLDLRKYCSCSYRSPCRNRP